MRPPRGITTKFDRVENGQVYFKVRATKFYLFKTILRIAGQNIHHPITSFLVVVYAFYYLVRN